MHKPINLLKFLLKLKKKSKPQENPLLSSPKKLLIKQKNIKKSNPSLTSKTINATVVTVEVKIIFKKMEKPKVIII